MIPKSLRWIILILLLLFPANALPQTTTYEPGVITMQTGITWKGFVWIGDYTHKSEKVFFKESRNSVPQEFTVEEVSMFTYGKKKVFASLLIPNETGEVRKFAEVLYSGRYSLLMYNDFQKIQYLIRESDGNLIELLSSYELPSQKNNYIMTFRREYRATLKEIFSFRPDLFPLIDNSDFNDEDLARIVKMVDRPAAKDPTAARSEKKEASFNVPASPGLLPPVYFAGMYAGFSPVRYYPESSMKTPATISLLSAGISFGASSTDRVFEITMNTGIVSGKVIANNTTDYYYGTIYTEESAEITMYNIGLNLRVYPVRYFFITPYAGAGFSSFGYLSYDKKITEETFNEAYDYVLTEIYDDFETPGPGINLILTGGGIYTISDRASIRLNLEWAVPINKTTGLRYLNGINLSYIHHFTGHEK